MYLDSVQRRGLGETAAVLSDDVTDSRELRTALVGSIAELLRADHVASFVWNRESARFEAGVTSDADLSVISHYEQEAQFTDIIASSLRARMGPTRVCDVIPQKTLTRSPFFDSFLRPAGLHWGLNLFAVDDAVDLGDLRVWRSRARGNFTGEEVGMARILYPAITAALRRCNARGPGRRSVTTRSSSVAWLREMHGLSRRQAEVVLLVSEGHADKEVARRLRIGFTTTRTHLKEGLTRLGLNNRKELIRFVVSAQRDPGDASFRHWLGSRSGRR